MCGGSGGSVGVYVCVRVCMCWRVGYVGGWVGVCVRMDVWVRVGVWVRVFARVLASGLLGVGE